MNRYKIRLEIGEDLNFPEGDPLCGYEFEAPLNSAGVLDAVEWKRDPDSYPVKRFWRNETPKFGRLLYTSNDTWRFHYSEVGEPDDFAFRFNRKSFLKDQYVSIRDHAAEMRVFRVVFVQRMEESDRKYELSTNADVT